MFNASAVFYPDYLYIGLSIEYVLTALYILHSASSTLSAIRKYLLFDQKLCSQICVKVGTLYPTKPANIKRKHYKC